MAKGFFITLEGGEGAGKSTQISGLKTALEDKGFEVVTTREPGGTPLGQKIRPLLVSGDDGNWDMLSELMLFSADRRQHLIDLIWPALEEGKVVISDRFADSTMAYQGYARGLDKHVIQQAYDTISEGFVPDLTLILDMDPETGLRRAKERGEGEDRFEKAGLAFHEKVRAGFLDIARQAPERCVIINADQDIETVKENIQDVVEGRLPRL